MIHDAPNVNYLFAGLLVEELVRHGVEWFVISPGSRSAPLAWTAASHPKAKTVVHFDERGAAFHALGIAKATLKPAAFICTSGTAAANALPAAVEACYSGIPLILITADRPERLQGSGANQTINQHGLYRNFVRDEKNFAVSAADFDAVTVLQSIDDAVCAAKTLWPGPVHLNCQLDEPLTPVSASDSAFNCGTALKPIEAWTRSGLPISSRIRGTAMGALLQSRLQEIISRPEPGLVVVGQLSDTAERDQVRAQLDKLRWPYIPDITSGLRLGPYNEHSTWWANHDAPALFDHAQTLVHIGGPVTSRRILDAMARFPSRGAAAREYVRVTLAPGPQDPAGIVTLRIPVAVTAVLEAMVDGAHRTSSTSWPASMLRRGEAVAETFKNSFDSNAAVTEPSLAHFAGALAPREGTIFVGNSMPIRDLDMYGHPHFDPPPWIYANRGASGIDGNIATAAGIARGLGRPVVAVLGDLATLHDLNSIALLNGLPAPVSIVVVNNDGGGIFHFLPIAEHGQHFEPLFGTPHGLALSSVAATFRIPHYAPKTIEDLCRTSQESLEAGQSCLIEVYTSRTVNLRLHRELDAKIRAALDKA